MMVKISVYYLGRCGEWVEAGRTDSLDDIHVQTDEVKISLCFETSGAYTLSLRSAFPTRVKLVGELTGETPWHFIPCCIHGDNNLDGAKPGQYPNLTNRFPEEDYSSPYWEFRADRASHPLSVLMTDSGSVGISIDPYCNDAGGVLVRNGLFSELPNRFGVTLGYANLPHTFINKKTIEDHGLRPSTSDLLCSAVVSGKVFQTSEKGLPAVAPMVEALYEIYREQPQHARTFREAAHALLDSFVEQNWSDEFKHYTNQSCSSDDKTELAPWRGLYEIAWTGGVIQGFPFLVAEDVLDLPKGYFAGRKDGRTLIGEVAASVNPTSGLFYDLTRELNGSRVNGWWSPMKVVWDCHASYTNGQALYYLFLAIMRLRKLKQPVPDTWLAAATGVADSFVQLQREDGCCGYAFRQDRREVSDWDGFGGCWVTAGFSAAFSCTGEARYLTAARKGMAFYRKSISACNACGTPMDTWKSPEEEGNLAFVKAARLLHQATGDAEFLQMLKEGAQYEYLWRYGFKAVPEVPPLKDSGWNSCGGSVTSVSNPHLHPMGLLVTEDLHYLAKQTGKEYHRNRAEDAVAWAMQCMELYPEVSGYGRYGVLTERFCPSDGLTIETFPDGSPSSLWFSYNGWAAANVLEALLWMIESDPTESISLRIKQNT
jgi:hypothetical protein